MADEHQFLGRGARRPAPSCRNLPSRPAAHIVNISSIFGIIAPPGQTAYCASKFAVRGFSESLRHELAMAKSPVRLSVVHPGGIATNIVRNMRTGVAVTDNARRAKSIECFDKEFAKTTPAAAAQRIIAGIEKNAPRILIGGDARILDLLQRILPGTYWSIMARKLEKRMTAGGEGVSSSRRAGTHTPRRLFCERQLTPAYSPTGRGVWVPAFAGRRRLFSNDPTHSVIARSEATKQSISRLGTLWLRCARNDSGRALPPHQLIRKIPDRLAVDRGAVPLAHGFEIRGAFAIGLAHLEA